MSRTYTLSRRAALCLAGATALLSCADNQAPTTEVTEGHAEVALSAAERLDVLGATRLSDGKTQIILGWSLPGAVRVEVEGSAGWAPFAFVPDGKQLYAMLLEPGTAKRVRIAADVTGGRTTAALRVFAIEHEAYELRGQRVPNVPFATTLRGVVRFPANLASAPAPLAILLHGNHGNCRLVGTTNDSCSTIDEETCRAGYKPAPSAEGMAYLADTLAARGMIAVSISANTLNCRNDYIMERADLILEHLRRWKAWNQGANAPFARPQMFADRIDLKHIGLIGHSRGGEAVVEASRKFSASPIADLDIESVFAIAPTSFHKNGLTDVAYAVMLPACDGDVYTLDGQHTYNRSKSIGTGKTQVLFGGANHNFFNTEWKSDDNDECAQADLAGSDAQQTVLALTLGSWMTSTLQGSALAPELRADAAFTPALEAQLDDQPSLMVAHGSSTLKEISAFGAVTGLSNNKLGGFDTYTGFDRKTLDRQGTVPAVAIRWLVAGAKTTFGLNGIDASSYAVASLRLASSNSQTNNDLTGHKVTLILKDTAGTRATVVMPAHAIVPAYHLGPMNNHVIPMSVRVPLADFVAAAPTLKLTSLAELTLALDDTHGDLRLAEVEFAGN